MCTSTVCQRPGNMHKVKIKMTHTAHIHTHCTLYIPISNYRHLTIDALCTHPMHTYSCVQTIFTLNVRQLHGCVHVRNRFQLNWNHTKEHIIKMKTFGYGRMNVEWIYYIFSCCSFHLDHQICLLLCTYTAYGILMLIRTINWCASLLGAIDMYVLYFCFLLFFKESQSNSLLLYIELCASNNHLC